MGLLEKESELIEIVRLVGAESISAADQMALETAKSIREDYLHQNAYHKVDTHTSLDKQRNMLGTILYFHKKGLEAIDKGAEPKDIFALAVREDIARAKYIPEDEKAKLNAIRNTIDDQIGSLYVTA